MRIEIESVTRATPEQWDTIWNGCDHATYYHSRYWAELWQAYAPGRHTAVANLVRFTDGAHALLPLTLTRHSKGLTRVWESGPYLTYGGWLSNDPLSAQHAEALEAYLLRLPNLVWMTNPFNPLAPAAAPGANGAEATWTRVFDLRGESDGMNKRAERYHRAAHKAGLRLRPLRVDDMPAVDDIYRDNRGRWEARKTMFASRLFPLILRLPQCDFVGCELPSGELAGVMAALRSKHHIAVWFGVAHSAHLAHHPFQFMHGELIKKYRDAGFRWYDIHPSGDRPTLDQFKEQLGARKLPLLIHRRASYGYKALQRVREWVNAFKPAGVTDATAN